MRDKKQDPLIIQSRKGRFLLPYLVLLLCLLFTFIVSYYVYGLAQAQDRARFENYVLEIDNRIKRKVQTSITLLRAASGLFAASDGVSAEEFHRFVDEIELQKNYPGIQGIGFSKKVKPSEVAQLIGEMRKRGFPDFKIWPESSRSEYNSIIYLEPLDARNRTAIGFDMFTEPVRRQAMESARDSGSPIASGRVVLVQDGTSENKQAAFLIYAPLYRNSASTSNQTERRNALIGFVYSPYRLDDFLNALDLGPLPEVAFLAYDGSQLNSESLLYASESSTSRSGTPRFTMNRTQEVAGRNWTIVYETKPSFEAESSQNFVRYTLVAGILLSSLFFWVTRSQVSARAAAEDANAEVRQSEATIRKTLTQRKQAEDALREGEERYRELVENANDIVYILELDGRFSSINRAAQTITEYSQEELLAMKLQDILAPESRAIGEEMLHGSMSAPEKTSYEIQIISKSGQPVTLEMNARPMFRKGKPDGIQGIARDISTRKRAEEALREADLRALSAYERLLERISGLAQALGTARELEAIFRALFEFTKVSVPTDGFFVSLYDPVLNVRTACYAWGDGEEVDVSELPTMPVTSQGPNSRAVTTGKVIITDDYMQATKGHPSVIVGPDDGTRPQSSIAIPMAVMGRIIGTIEVQSYLASAYKPEHVTAMSMAANLTAVAIDNVRLLQREGNARHAAEDSNRVKDEFLATVSHELRTPLTAILGWARLLESGSLDDAIVHKAVETIGRNAKAQARIVDDILDVSRIITGNLYLDLHPIEIGPIIDAAINVVRPTADAKGIVVDRDLGSAPSLVSGDANRLQQVIWNLLSNAVKFTGTGGRVTVALRQVDSNVEIAVSDTGSGVNKDFLPFVFDRFRQADSTTTRQHGGLGLGLAIARHLIEIHGGSIRAESEGENQGSRFTIVLPLVAATAKSIGDDLAMQPLIRDPARQILSGVNVLLVDDDADNLELMSTALMSRQASVTAVGTAEEAMQIIAKRKPDVLISDIAMPEEDGYGLIARVRSLDEAQSIAAVAITAYAKQEDRERVLSSGYQEYLAKPIELSELVSVVARAAKRAF